MTSEEKGRKGMATFGVICFGQMISIFGSAMTQFALMIWAWQQTGQATSLALIGFFGFAPALIMAPIAGALVDRWNRKTTIILSDLAAGMGTVAGLILYSSGMLEIWHLYVIAAGVGAFGSFQFPAYSAAITMLVEKENYERATAIWGLAFAVGGGILGPAMAVFLLALVGISGVLTFDIVTFTFAIGLILFIKIPEPERAKDIGKGIKGLFKDAGYGFKYIFKRKSLLGLQLTYFTSNFFGNMSMILLAPMILAVTASNEATLATIMVGMGAGSIVGGIVLTFWGGSKTNKILVIMSGIVIEG
ncbi:MAG: MFS transporter, partial [Thermoplasmata archaeon]|nr:MFS transporter [Thermoplasmata archaeon]